MSQQMAVDGTTRAKSDRREKRMLLCRAASSVGRRFEPARDHGANTFSIRFFTFFSVVSVYAAPLNPLSD